MADDTTNVGARDRATVADGQDYEVEHFATQHAISIEEARELIQKHGNNRRLLMEEVAALKDPHGTRPASAGSSRSEP